MSEKDAFHAQQQARREVTSDPERPLCHEGAIRIYLAGFAYTARKHDAEAHAVPPRVTPETAAERDTDQAAQ